MKCVVIKRGDIFYADLRPVVGSEQGGIRPVLIIQNAIGNKHSPTKAEGQSLPFRCRNIEESQPCTVCQFGTSYIVFCGNLDERYGKWYFIHDVFFHIVKRKKKEGNKIIYG